MAKEKVLTISDTTTPPFYEPTLELSRYTDKNGNPKTCHLCFIGDEEDFSEFITLNKKNATTLRDKLTELIEWLPDK